MIKNKVKIKELKQSWKIERSFDMLSAKEQWLFTWWMLTGNVRGLWFIFQQHIMGKHARAAYDESIAKSKESILWDLMIQGYYFHNC